MTSMTTAALGLPYGRPLTVADFMALREARWPGGYKYELIDGVLIVSPSPFSREKLRDLPDDGHRYEMFDGTLIVSPSPRYDHQVAVGNLYFQLRLGCPTGFQVLTAPFDVSLDEENVLQPDLIVAPKSAFTDRDLPTAPLLAVEVLSPSTRSLDLTMKKDKLAHAGCPHYWIVDVGEPSMTAWNLVNGAYVTAAEVSGNDPFTVTEPFPVSFTPASLLD